MTVQRMTAPPVTTEAQPQAARLKQANYADVPALAVLYQTAWNDPKEDEAQVAAWLEGGGALTFVCGDTLLSALRWREAPYGWEVGRLATLPEYRGQGFGRWLTTRLEALAIQHNIPELRLSLSETQAELLPYYTRMGYRPKDAEKPLELSKRVGGVWQRQG